MSDLPGNDDLFGTDDDFLNEEMGLLGYDLDIDEEKDPKQSSKSSNSGCLKGFLSLLSLIVVVLVSVITGFVVVMNSRQSAEPPPPPPPPITSTLQLVNAEQVRWADKLCIEVSSWQGEQTPVTKFPEPASGNAARLAMIENLYINARSISSRAEALAAIPEEAKQNALTDIEDVTVADNYANLPEGMDPKVRSTTQRLTIALNGYAASLRDMAVDLEKLSSYNPYGIRLKMNGIISFFDEMNDELGRELSGALSMESFDNIATMEEVSSLETCNGSLIEIGELRSEHGQEVDSQRIIREYIISERCKDFLRDYDSLSGSSEVVDASITACTSYTASATVNQTHPLLQGRIDDRDPDRAKPKLPAVKPATTQTRPTEQTGGATTSSPTTGASSSVERPN